MLFVPPISILILSLQVQAIIAYYEKHNSAMIILRGLSDPMLVKISRVAAASRLNGLPEVGEAGKVIGFTLSSRKGAGNTLAGMDVATPYSCASCSSR